MIGLIVPSTDQTLFVATQSKTGAAASPFVVAATLVCCISLGYSDYELNVTHLAGRNRNSQPCHQRGDPHFRHERSQLGSLYRLKNPVRLGDRRQGSSNLQESQPDGSALDLTDLLHCLVRTCVPKCCFDRC